MQICISLDGKKFLYLSSNKHFGIIRKMLYILKDFDYFYYTNTNISIKIVLDFEQSDEANSFTIMTVFY